MLDRTVMPQPLDTSPWVAMSLLQKSIRRGEHFVALQAAATLHVLAPEKLWRRLVCIAFEDVGLADMTACSDVLAAAMENRSGQAGGWNRVEDIVSRLAATHKCRASDDLLMGADSLPSLSSARSKHAVRDQGDLRADICTEPDVYQQAILLRYLLGTSRGPERTSIPVAGNPKLAFAAMREMGVKEQAVRLSEAGFRYTGSALPPLLGLLSLRLGDDVATEIRDDRICAAPCYQGVPLWAYDLYSREGRRALGKFLKMPSRTANWINSHIRAQKVEFFGGLVFRIEGQRCRNRMRWQLGDELRFTMDLEGHGPEALDLIEMAQADLPLLHQSRLETLIHMSETERGRLL